MGIALGDETMAYIDRKIAGMYALLDNHGKNMEAEAKVGAPWTDRTSTARRALSGGVDVVEPGRKWVLYLAHGVQYGVHLEEGSGPREIRPVNKKALSWPGAPHPVKKVNHPGSKPYPIVGPTVDNYFPRLRKNVEKYWGST